MDSIEVAVRFTVAIMARPNSARKGVDIAEQYVETFAEVLKRLRVVMPTQSVAHSSPPSPRQPTSEIFPLSHDR